MPVVLLFENTRFVVMAENHLRSNNIGVKVLPAPVSITKQCGMALEISTEDLENATSILTKENINFKIYEE